MEDSASTGRKGSKKFLPALVLFLLAPFVGEVLPGARPIESMLNPFNFIVLTTLYGSGAIIIRETVIHWRKGWPSIILLGFAYGIVEEGIGAQSFANPAWAGLSVPAMYGRFLGVNWVWIFQILLYHSLVSISLSILIVSFLFPKRRGERYTSPRTLGICFAALILNLALEVFVLFPYNAGISYYIAMIGAIIMLSVLAKKVPSNMSALYKISIPNWAIAACGIAFPFALFGLIESYLPYHVSPLVDIMATFFLFGLIVVFIMKVKAKGLNGTLFYLSFGAVLYFTITSVIFNIVNIFSSVLFLGLMLIGRMRLRKELRVPSSPILN